MDLISSRGNRTGISIITVLVLSLCSAAGTYRLKKTAEIKRWQKEMAVYSIQLENENLVERNPIEVSIVK